MPISEQAAALNEEILAHVDAIGGGSVWDATIFAVTLIEIAPNDEDVAELSRLSGVQQIALNACRLSFASVLSVARTPGLDSLVLSRSWFSEQQLCQLRTCVPELVLVSDEA